jgi:23S rRNA (adenine2503-C2)-methyltransferase
MEAALTDFDVATLGDLFADWGHSRQHALTVLRRFYRTSGQISFDDSLGSLIGGELRQKLIDYLRPRQSRVIRRHDSTDGAVKLLVGFNAPPDDSDPPAAGAAEAVLMPAYRADRAAGCVSSQIGCAMGCDFCASARGGLSRNLSAGEIVEQFLHLHELAAALGRRLASIVFMGMGEPMHNLDAVIAAIGRMADPNLGGLGWRQITVSTVGIVPGIDRLAAADLNVNLAVSLHAPDDATRSMLVPANRRWNVAEVVAATARFSERTGRISTIEYCMLAGVNDSIAQARQLAELLHGMRVHVNLIPYNQIGSGLSGRIFQASAREQMNAFLAELSAGGVVAHARRTRGADIAAACGQLRRIDSEAVEA